MKKIAVVLLVLVMLLVCSAACAELDLSGYGFSIDIPENLVYAEPDAEYREKAGCIAIFYKDDIELHVFINTIDEGDTVTDWADLMLEAYDGTASGVLTVGDIEVGYAEYDYPVEDCHFYCVTYFAIGEDDSLVVFSFYQLDNPDLKKPDAIIKTISRVSAVDAE